MTLVNDPTNDPNDDPTVDHPTPRGGSTRRRGTILGVAAGVLAGGAIGLAMTVPTFSSAAGDATGAVAALQQTDETSTDETSTDETSTDGPARPAPGVRLRESLQALVDDGTLTAEQADAVAEHLVAQRPDRPGHRGDHRGGRPGRDGEVVAELLGIEAAELRSALRDGQSIADLAETNGVEVQTVIDALVAEVDGHLALAVENGRLTEDEAAEKSAAATERITARVNGERPSDG